MSSPNPTFLPKNFETFHNLFTITPTHQSPSNLNQRIGLSILLFFNNLFPPQMKYLAAYALLALSGKKEISAQDLKSLLASVQSHATDDEINQVIKAVRGKPLHQLIAEGQARLGSAAPAPTAAKPVEKKEAPKKQQPKKKVEQPKKKVEEPKEEEDADFGD